MQMFIANPMQQNRIISYQLPESVSASGYTKTFTQPVGMGQQIRINGKNGDLSQPDIDRVLDHLRKYGMISVDEINRATGLVPLIYSIDKPIRADVIAKVLNHNKGVQIGKGREARMRAALAANVAIENHANQVEAEVPFSEVGIDEENQGSFASDGPALSEGFHIAKQPGERSAPRGKGRKRNGVG